MNDYWAMLDIAPTNDVKAIKRAYATLLKSHRPEDNAERFQQLREAYEWACQIGIHHAERWQDDDYEDSDYDDVVEDIVEQSVAPVAPESTQPALSFIQALPEIASILPKILPKILPSVPTRFPITFEPAPSPTFPVIASEPKQSPHDPGALLVSQPNITYVQDIELAGRRMRSMPAFVAAFWAQSQSAKTVLELQVWLQAQAEYEALQMRPHLAESLADALTEETWPWPAVLAVAELLDWGTIGNLVGHELNQAVQLAHLQQRAAITKAPRWHQFLSKTAAAHFLLTPFSWPKALFSALLPRTQHIDELCDEISRAGVDPSLVFKPKQIEFQRKLRAVDFNLPRIAYALVRLVGWPVFFSLLFIGVDATAPLVGLTFGLLCLVLWIGLVSNRLLFRTLWTPSPSGTNSKAFWLSIGITLAITGISEAFQWPNFALLLAVFLLFAVARDASTAFASAVLGSLCAFVAAVAIWPTQAPDKFLITAPITLSVVMMSLYFYQRRLPTEKLLARLLKAPVQPKPVTAFNSGRFSWWWLVAGILLMRLLAAGH